MNTTKGQIVFNLRDYDIQREKVLCRRLVASLNRLSKVIDKRDEHSDLTFDEVTSYLAELNDCYIFVTDMLAEYSDIQSQLLMSMSDLKGYRK